MTKANVLGLADALRATRPTSEYGRANQWDRNVAAIADWLGEQVPEFDRARWLEYVYRRVEETYTHRGECSPLADIPLSVCNGGYSMPIGYMIAVMVRGWLVVPPCLVVLVAAIKGVW